MANGVTSQWDDIHVRLGNYEPRVKETHQSVFTKEEIEKAEQIDPLSNKKLDELDELEDDFDDDFLEQYKQKRLAELKEINSKPVYGSVREISKEHYVNEVTNAPQDVTVILNLYQDYIDKSVKINLLLDELALKYVNYKILKIKADKCIEKFPDDCVPCFIIYKNGKLTKNIQSVDKEFKKMTPEALEAYLKIIQVLPLEEGDEDVEKYEKFIMKKAPKKNDADLSDSDDDDRQYISTNFKKV